MYDHHQHNSGGGGGGGESGEHERERICRHQPFVATSPVQALSLTGCRSSSGGGGDIAKVKDASLALPQQQQQQLGHRPVGTGSANFVRNLDVQRILLGDSHHQQQGSSGNRTTHSGHSRVNSAKVIGSQASTTTIATDPVTLSKGSSWSCKYSADANVLRSAKKMASTTTANSSDDDAKESFLPKRLRLGFLFPFTNSWSLFGSTQIKYRSNEAFRIVAFFLVLLIASAIILVFRIQGLEVKNAALEHKMTVLQEELLCVMKTINSVPDLSSPISVSACMTHDSQQSKEMSYRKHKKTSLETITPAYQARNKRSVMKYEDKFFSEVTPLSNNTLSSAYNMSISRMSSANLRKSRGNKYTKKRRLKFFRLQRKLKREDSKLKNLKLKLEAARTRVHIAKSFAAEYKTQNTQIADALLRKEPRAVFLTVRDPSVKIEHPEQVIGPWHIPDSGDVFGFSKLWYQNIKLDENATSVIFQEDGLYLVYAQVYYKIAQRKKDKPLPMGFRIYLDKKNPNFRKPLPIAECVPAFPKTYYQTCFTQICWYVEQGDVVYLEHFTGSLPIIEAENMGQTFVGIVKLS